MNQRSRERADRERALTVGELRFRAGINHFKRSLLHDHIPGRAQARELFDVLERITKQLAPKALLAQRGFIPAAWLGMRVSPRSWQAWFAQEVETPKAGAQRSLDEVARRAIRWSLPNGNVEQALPPGFYRDLIDGGLLRTLLAKTGAGEFTPLLHARAAAYKPLSAWHLHFDALELRAFSSDHLDVSWAEIVRVAATRILELLHELWRPGDGRIYRQLSSDTRRQWSAASEAERMAIRERFSRLVPDQFDASMNAGASPSWERVGVGLDIPVAHVHRLLFSMGADTEFLEGDRLSAWALDLATSGLAAHALAWTDRYRVLGHQITEERLFLGAIDALLLTSAPTAVEPPPGESTEPQHLDDIELVLASAMSHCAGDWHHSGVTGLHKAREAYMKEMAGLGISLADVEYLSRAAQRAEQLEYRRLPGQGV
ncbi:MAG: hypothetical protein ABL916_11545 [Burkholderiaceae bacterium]